jgi:threonine dehydrogenase-like Zn-dependent dehydrogenase
MTIMQPNSCMSTRPGSRFSYLGRQVLGHHGLGAGHIEELVELTRRGRLDLSRSAGGILPLAEVADAVHRLQHKDGDPIRLVLRP